ncbi:MAG TPA: hypothetical protein VJ546_06090 [Bacillales bacterium]|nr:hypothetical protein [Bacillales bacterium]
MKGLMILGTASDVGKSLNNDGFRNHWLDKIRKSKGKSSRESISLHSLKDKRYDVLAEMVKENLNWDQIKRVVAQWQES